MNYISRIEQGEIYEHLVDKETWNNHCQMLWDHVWHYTLKKGMEYQTKAENFYRESFQKKNKEEIVECKKKAMWFNLAFKTCQSMIPQCDITVDRIQNLKQKMGRDYPSLVHYELEFRKRFMMAINVNPEKQQQINSSAMGYRLTELRAITIKKIKEMEMNTKEPLPIIELENDWEYAPINKNLKITLK